MSANNESGTDNQSFLDTVFSEEAQETLKRYYPAGVLAVFFTFMVAVRVQSYKSFIRDSGVFFSGNDPWYHYRQTAYTVHNWPKTMSFDPWTGYPSGSVVAQFGTLYDQILATVALIVGLGSPSDQTIRLVLIFAPPVFAALTLLPTYFVTKRLTKSRAAGLMSGLALALMPGVFLQRGLVGVADHNIAEPLFMTFGVAATLVAFRQANTDAIAYEVLADRDIDALREWLKLTVFAGIATGSYILVWPPGVFLIGILGVFYAVYASIVGSAADRSPEPVLLTGCVSMVVTGLLLLIPIDAFKFGIIGFTLAQVTLPLAVAAECAVLAGLARFHESSNQHRAVYPALVSGAAALAAGVVYVTLPNVFNLVYTNVMRIVGFGTQASTRTIGEAQPFIQNGQVGQTIVSEYGLLFFVALGGLALVLWRTYRRYTAGRPVAGQVLIVIWTLFLTAAAFTQVRFNYYLAVPVSILSAYGIYNLLEFTDVPETFPKLKGYQVITIALVVMMVVPMLVVPVSSSAVGRAQHNGVGGYTGWHDTLEWMNDNTPEPEGMDYYGSYERQDDFQYPDGSYGVMSWWDYGHWMTVTAERIPVSNPFQKYATESAQYLLATNESQAQSVATNLSEDNESDVRYVAVDWKMVETNSKFLAPTVWHPNVNRSDFVKPVYTEKNGRLGYGFTMRQQRFYESLMVRMYYYHGSRVEGAQNLVVDWETTSVDTARGPMTIPVVPSASTGTASDFTNASQSQQSTSGVAVKRFNSSAAAQQYVQNDSTSQLGGVGIHPPEDVEALNHYRLVKVSEKMAASKYGYRGDTNFARYAGGKVSMYDVNPLPAWVKVFERVPGATVHGSGAPANSTVVASVQMKVPTQGTTFVYRQQAQTDENGNFTMTLPYSTTGYDQFGPENGHTNVSVRAAGPYTFQSVQQSVTQANNSSKPQLQVDRWVAQTNVTEAQVLGERDSNVTVTLEKYQPPQNDSAENNSSDSNSDE